MEKNILNTDLTGKVAVVTGASGTLCSIFAKALARAGAKVALLGRNMDKLKELADEIEAEGGIAKGYTCNVMNKANCLQVAEDVLADLGPCDILVNGAGGNNARADTDKEYFEMADLESDTVTFFDLDESGVEMVFNLNFIGTLLPTQAFARQMVGRAGCNILNISSMNAYLPLTKIPAYSGSKAAVTNFTQGWQCISARWVSVSTPLHRVSLPASRTQNCSTMRMGSLLPAPKKSLPPPRWGVLATVRKTLWVHCCSC